MEKSTESVIDRLQCRAARELLEWSQDDLERESRVAKKTIADFERGARVPMPRTLAAIQEALERGGVEFIPSNGSGPGLRLAKRKGKR